MTVDTFSLEGKIAIVSGSGRENGMGAAIAMLLAKNGASVTINHVSESSASRAEVVATKIRNNGGKAIVVKASVDSPAGAKFLVEETLSHFKTDHIDILVNNAGISVFAGTMEHSEEQIKQIFAVNVYGPIFLTQETVPYMPKGGRIINISSIASKLGFDSIPIYGAAKAAVDSLSYAWAQEFGRSKGITVNSVSPGPVSTDILPEGADENVLFAEMIKRTRAAERVGTVQDIADIVLLISSEKGRWITGQAIAASGGITGP